MKIKNNNMRYKVKEIICENPCNIVSNIKIMNSSGEIIGTANEGFICLNNSQKNVSFTFQDDLYLDKQGDEYFLVKLEKGEN